VTTLQIKVNKALEKIGVSNGTNPPDSQDAVDLAAHKYGCAAVGSSFFEKAKKQAKAELEQALGLSANAKLTKAMSRVLKNEVKEDIELARGAVYAVQAEVKNGATFLDLDALRVELKMKMKSDEVDALFARHTSRRAPSVSFKILEASE
jgi:hypothetical protein